MRSLAKLLCSPEKLCILLQNLYILQANTKIVWGMQKFCKQTQNKYKYTSNQIFEQNVCSHLIFPSPWCRIVQNHALRVCVSKEITTVIRTNCYILTWCALYCTWHIFLQRVNAEKSSTVTSYKSKYQRKCYSSRHTCSMNLFSAVYD